ncbi:MAG: DUF5663 domain-containing protein [Candidatus Paceibacterota bacterium]|jgi:hypothetical protein
MSTITIKKDLIDLFHLDKLPPEKSVEMLDRLGKLIFQAVLVRVLPTLSEENFKKYEEMVDSKKTEGDEIFFFLREKVPDFDKIVAEESENLRLELMKDPEEIKK